MRNDAPFLFDVSRLLWRQWANVRPTGIDRICLAWLDHFAGHAQAVVSFRRISAILPVEASRQLFRLLQQDNHDRSRAMIRAGMAATTLRHAAGLFAGLKGHGRPWLNVGHTGLDRPGLPAWVRQAEVRPVMMLHDIIPITHAQYCRAGEAERHAIRIRTMLELSCAIIGNSQHTIDELALHAARQRLPVPPTLAIWPGTKRLPVTNRPTSAGPPSFVILGTIEGRKNHMLLLDVWERLMDAQGQAAPRLVIIGRRGWACDDVLARLDSGRFGDRVVETGALDDDAIARWLADARALLFPSFAEGYGLPLVEALDAGVPVIASDLPVFREISQGVPELLSPDDVAGWQAAITAYAADGSPDRDAQMARLAGFRAPDWPGHFAKVDAFLKSLPA